MDENDFEMMDDFLEPELTEEEHELVGTFATFVVHDGGHREDMLNELMCEIWDECNGDREKLLEIYQALITDANSAAIVFLKGIENIDWDQDLLPPLLPEI